MAMVLVGATIVGAIGTRWSGDIRRSGEKQYFLPTKLLLAQRFSGAMKWGILNWGLRWYFYLLMVDVWIG